MPGPVSTWMMTLWAGKPSRYEASQLGRLSLLPSMGWGTECRFSDSVVMNGNGECSTVAASSGGSEAQADRLGPKVGG